jgi:hypothetical protein
VAFGGIVSQCHEGLSPDFFNDTVEDLDAPKMDGLTALRVLVHGC